MNLRMRHLKWFAIGTIVILFSFALTSRNVWKKEKVLSKFGTNTFVFAADRIFLTNLISSDGIEKTALAMGGKVTLTNLGSAVGQGLSAMIIYDDHAKSFITNTIHQGERTRAPGWHWTMLSRKTPVTVLVRAGETYTVNNRSFAYFWTDYNKAVP